MVHPSAAELPLVGDGAAELVQLPVAGHNKE